MAKNVSVQKGKPVKLNNRLTAMGLVGAFGSFVSRTSSSRLAMVNSQYAQAIIPAKADTPRILTGLESQLAQHCFGAKAPTQMMVIDVIPKYYANNGMLEGIKSNPKLIIVYQDLDAPDLSYNAIEINSHIKTHDTFGYRIQQTKTAHNFSVNQIIPKGTVLTHSSNIKYDMMEEGMFGTGLMANVIYLALPGTIEDGFRVSKSFNERARSLTVGSRVAEWGKNSMPLNLYGDERNYRPYPDIGDTIRPDGILMATRTIDPFMGAVDMTTKALMEVDLVHDNVIYAKPGAKIVDVNVISSMTEGRFQTTPPAVAKQANYYAELQSGFYERLLECHAKIMRQDYRARIQPEFQRLLVAALADKPNDPTRNNNRRRTESIKRYYRGNPLDEFRVEITFENEFEIGLSAKITDLAGGDILY